MCIKSFTKYNFPNFVKIEVKQYNTFSYYTSRLGTSNAVGHSGFLAQLMPHQHKGRNRTTQSYKHKMPRDSCITELPTAP